MARNWADERYVRLYTRDTIDWQSLSFEAQGLFSLLLRKVDRAGILNLGKRGPQGIAVAVGHPARWATFESALKELIDDGCVRVTDAQLVIPNFLEAQEARQSDKARQQKARELSRDLALAAEQSVTPRDELSQNVTECHTPSHGVTPNQPCRAEPAEPAEPKKEDLSTSVAAVGAFRLEPDAIDELKDRRRPASPLRELPPKPGEQVFAHWCQVMGKTGAARLTKDRTRAIQARLKEGYTVEQLKLAVDGCALTPHNMGQNEQGARFDDLELICRNGSQVERFITNARAPPRPLAGKGRASEADKDWSNFDPEKAIPF